MASYVRDSAKTEKMGETSVMLYSKTTKNGNVVYVGSFVDEKCGKRFYLRTSLVPVASQKYPGKDCAIVNVTVYKNAR